MEQFDRKNRFRQISKKLYTLFRTLREKILAEEIKPNLYLSRRKNSNNFFYRTNWKTLGYLDFEPEKN